MNLNLKIIGDAMQVLWLNFLMWVKRNAQFSTYGHIWLPRWPLPLGQHSTCGSYLDQLVQRCFHQFSLCAIHLMAKHQKNDRQIFLCTFIIIIIILIIIEALLCLFGALVQEYMCLHIFHWFVVSQSVESSCCISHYIHTFLNLFCDCFGFHLSFSMYSAIFRCHLQGFPWVGLREQAQARLMGQA